MHQWEERAKVLPASNHRRLVEVEVEVVRDLASPGHEQGSGSMAPHGSPAPSFLDDTEELDGYPAPSLLDDTEELEVNSTELADRALQRSEALLLTVAAILEPHELQELRLPCLLGRHELSSADGCCLQSCRRFKSAEYPENLETATPIAARALAKSELLLQELLEVECARE